MAISFLECCLMEPKSSIKLDFQASPPRNLGSQTISSVSWGPEKRQPERPVSLPVTIPSMKGFECTGQNTGIKIGGSLSSSCGRWVLDSLPVRKWRLRIPGSVCSQSLELTDCSGNDPFPKRMNDSSNRYNYVQVLYINYTSRKMYN